MYLAVDIGGTKTLVAYFDATGKLKNEVKFATPEGYEDWLEHFKAAVAELKCDDFKAGCVAIPGVVDRRNGVGIRFGNLAWEEVAIAADIERLVHCPIVVENDAKVAGLSEAINIKDEFQNVLYITIGTGIGVSHIRDGVIDLSNNDRGGNAIMLGHRGKRQSWESFASGKAIVQRFGKKASEIEDQSVWKSLAHDFAAGILDLIAKYQPQVVVIGGGVGTHFSRYAKFLETELKNCETPLMKIPPLRQAKRPEEAVLYGCYELTKEKYAHTTA